VTTNDCDVLVGWVGVLELGDKAGSADDIESGDTEKALGIVDAFALVDLGADGDSGVDLEDISQSNAFVRQRGFLTGFEMTRRLAFGAASAAALARSRTMEALVLNRSGNVNICAECLCLLPHTITSHARLSRNACRDENDLGAGQAFSEARWRRVITLDGALGVDVANIGSDTCVKALSVPCSSSRGRMNGPGPPRIS
jgi:hypothetical protein